MKADMLASQFATLQEPSDAIVADVSESPAVIVEQVLAELPTRTRADGRPDEPATT